ncbi:MAG: hypothetical protein BWY09_02374 [Candidatus Hydrogenedentes bacterium ADurb.Bin179]|nr:MAG: hypothetical protein BWY09_02374 [Candidatus Hydrogenedentes bacterium ADurb.Bin179]
MVEVHGHGNVGKLFRGRFHQFLQVDHLAVFQGAPAGLNDNRAVGIIGRLHDRLNLFHIVDVKRADAIAALRGFIQYLTHGYKWHGILLRSCMD